MPAAALSTLSEDILLEICRYISPIDLLALKQTCRALHAFGCTDYVWHQLRLDVPLDLPKACNIANLSAIQLQRLVTRAHRLDHNWRQQWTESKTVTRINHGGILSHLQLLDCAQWLFVLAPSHRSAFISLWSLHHINSVRKVLHFELPGTWRSWAAIQPSRRLLYFAAIVRTPSTEAIHIYSAVLPDSPPPLDIKSLLVPTLLHTINKTPAIGAFSDIHIYDHVVAVSLFSMPHTSVLLCNIHTGAEYNVRIGGLLMNVHLKLFEEYLAVVGVKADMALMVNIYALPPSITSSTPLPKTPTTVNDLGPPVFAFDPMPVLGQAEYHTASELSRSGALTLLCTDPKVDVLRHAGEFVARCSLPNRSTIPSRSPSVSTPHPHPHPGPTLPVQTHPISTPAHTLPEELCIGTSGVRAVWLERSWDTDAFRVMKMDFPLAEREKLVVGPLFRPSKALPFRPETCRSLAFDDAAGRLCLGLHNGEIIVLDFV